jgi:succinoglycan biosynthesis transport protein ExoP
MQPKPTLPPRSAPHQTGFGLHDILFVLFKHKGKIGILTALGVVCAAVVYFFYPATYESQAKLLVRYVVERSAVDAVDSNSAGNPANRSNVFVPAIASEIEILTSWDLAMQVAEAVGPKRLLPLAKDPVDQSAAARIVSAGLEVNAAKGANVLFVSYTNHDPQITTLVLDELVKRYFTKHLEVHRSAGAFDFVTQQTDQVRARLNQTEDALKALKQQAGIVSLLNESRLSLSAELARTDEQLRAAQTEFAEQQARVNQFEGLAPGAAPTISPRQVDTETKAETSPPPSASATPMPQATPTSVEVQHYDVLVARLTKLRQSAVELSSKYTAQNPLVKANEAQIADVDREKRALESKFPDLASRSTAITPSSGPPTNLIGERARLSGLVAKVEALKLRIAEVQTKVKQLADLGPQIAELERRKEMEEANYKYFQSTLEKARVDEALDPSKIPNITAVQKPSPPMLVTKQRDKLAGGLAAGGLALGLVFSLLSELILNRTIKRPLELERQLNVPLLLSIPYAGRNGLRQLAPNAALRAGDSTSKDRAGTKIAPWAPGHFIRSYCEAIRDRLGLYFELHQLTHKPKLIGVAGFSAGAGTSTLAAGLAAALSETDDGKVLLVDANLGPSEVHPFFQGKPAYPLANALDAGERIDPASENLYLATVGSGQNGIAQLGVKRFFDLMPNLKASDFDYIIFDMPPLTQTSPTWGMSAFMDKMLLVVEAEKNNRDMVKRGHAKLQAERDNVSVVFNKAQSFGPKWVSLEP